MAQACTWTGASATISDCEFTGHASESGAAVYGWFATLTAINSVFDANTTTDGGAVSVFEGTCSVAGCSFSNNTAAGHDGGGALLFTRTHASVAASGFTQNAALIWGSAVSVIDGDLTLAACSFTENQAQYGGAVSSRSSALHVTSCEFTANTAEQGGGIWCSTSAMDGQVASLEQCTFTGNAADFGGGVSARGNLTTITECAFEANTATEGGGLLGRGGEVIVTSSQLTGNKAIRGGAVAADGARMTFDDCTLAANEAEERGGALILGVPDSTAASTVTLIDSEFDGNCSGDVGGAVAQHVSSVAASSCLFTANQARLGGAYSADGSGEVLLSGCTFEANVASDDGGALHLQSDGATLEDCMFCLNVASALGGGVASATALTVTGGEFRENEAAIGAGMHIAGQHDISIIGSILEGKPSGRVRWRSAL